MMQRQPNIETERLLLVALLPEDIEALIAGDLEDFVGLAVVVGATASFRATIR